MTDAAVYYYFSEELQKLGAMPQPSIVRGAAGVASRGGKALWEGVKNTGRAAVEGTKATFTPSGWKEGWRDMAVATSEPKKKALRESIRDASTASEGFFGTTPAREYTAGFLDKPVDKQTVVERLRGGGWLSAAPKYQGDSKYYQARNLLHRALPGEKGVIVGLGGASSAGELASSETSEGRKKGWGERVGRAVGMGGSFVATNPLFRTHGLLQAGAGALVASELGIRGMGLAGRGADAGVGALTGVNAGGGQVPAPQG